MPENFFNTGLDMVSGTLEDFLAKIKMEIVKWGKVMREAGIQED